MMAGSGDQAPVQGVGGGGVLWLFRIEGIFTARGGGQGGGGGFGCTHTHQRRNWPQRQWPRSAGRLHATKWPAYSLRYLGVVIVSLLLNLLQRPYRESSQMVGAVMHAWYRHWYPLCHREADTIIKKSHSKSILLYIHYFYYVG